MSLVPSYDDSSNSNSSSISENSSDNEIISKTDESKPKIKLPTPTFNNGQQTLNKNNTLYNEDNLPKTSSVFKNPFIEAENTKEAILEKHVKMVETKEKTIVINGRKICWNYRKGKCRFGHNCKFAHDSDIQKTVIKEQIQPTNQFQQKLPQPNAQDLECIQNDTNLLQQQNQMKKRKRPGLTQGLIPGKKVMKNYAKQKL